MWATVQALSAFGLSIVPLIAIGQYPGSLKLYMGPLHRLTGMGSGYEVIRGAVLVDRFFPGGEPFWKPVLFIALLVMLVSFGYILKKDRDLLPYSISFDLMFLGVMYFRLESWVMFLLFGFGLAVFFGRKGLQKTAQIVLAVLALAMAIPWLSTPDRSIDPYLEMAQYISRAIPEESEIVTFRPGILSTVTGRELGFPEGIPYPPNPPNQALTKGAPDAEWAVITLAVDDAADVPSTYETKPYKVTPYGDFVLALMPMSVIPNKILIGPNISQY